VTEYRPTTVTVTAPPTTVVTPTPVVWSRKCR
jgi:hypothetical protein